MYMFLIVMIPLKWIEWYGILLIYTPIHHAIKKFEKFVINFWFDVNCECDRNEFIVISASTRYPLSVVLQHARTVIIIYYLTWPLWVIKWFSVFSLSSCVCVWTMIVIILSLHTFYIWFLFPPSLPAPSTYRAVISITMTSGFYERKMKDRPHFH